MKKKGNYCFAFNKGGRGKNSIYFNCTFAHLKDNIIWPNRTGTKKA